MRYAPSKIVGLGVLYAAAQVAFVCLPVHGRAHAQAMAMMERPPGTMQGGGMRGPAEDSAVRTEDGEGDVLTYKTVMLAVGGLSTILLSIIGYLVNANVRAMREATQDALESIKELRKDLIPLENRVTAAVTKLDELEKRLDREGRK